MQSMIITVRKRPLAVAQESTKKQCEGLSKACRPANQHNANYNNVKQCLVYRKDLFI